MPDQLSDVLDRLLATVGDVAYVLALDPVDRVVLEDGSAPAERVLAARAVAGMLATVDATVDTAGEAAVRSVVETADATFYAHHDPAGLVLVLVGPPAWNVALVRRSADAVLRDLDAATAVGLLRDRRRSQGPAAPAAVPGRSSFAQARRAAIRTTGTEA